MTDERKSPDMPDLPEAAVAPKSRWSLQLVWLVPIVAVVIGGWLAVRSIWERGPTITISFKNAEGIEAGKTKITFKDVQIGQVTTVRLSPDLGEVVVTAQMVKDFAPHLHEDTQFWLVRPRISGGNVSGLGTLVSGAYIAVNVGKSTQPQREFTALETPPVVDMDTPGHIFSLHSGTAGSLSVGSPVFYRQMQAGQVVTFQLDPDGEGVTFKIFINQEYVKYVTANTRFWNESGFDVTADANGIKLDVGSLVSILIGGVEFETPDLNLGAAAHPRADDYVLFANRTAALKNPESEVWQIRAVFDQSVRGLDRGAPVDFRGIPAGEVIAIDVDLDRKAGKLLIPVTMNIYPERLRSRELKHTTAPTEAEQRSYIDAMVSLGLRAQLRTGNLLTGQRYVTLDFVQNAPKARVDWSSTPALFPTSGGSLEELATTIASIAKKIDEMPIKQIGTDLHQTLQSANALIEKLDTQVTPEARGMLQDARKTLNNADRLLSPDAPLQQDAQAALREMSDAARALRVLADYLERHPESLIRGKPEDSQ